MYDSARNELSNTLRIPIAKLGAWEHPIYRYVVFTQKDFDDIKRNFENNEWGFEPYLRYGHARYPGATDGEPATAYLKKIEQVGDVLYGYFDAITPTVVEEIRGGRYRYASAELTRNALGKKLGRGPIGTILSAVSLTNAPFVPGMPRNEVLSQDPSEEHFFVLDQKEHPMPQENETATILQKLSTGMDKVLEFLSSNPFAAKGEGEGKHGEGMENLANASAMPDLQVDEKLTASPAVDTPVYENGVIAKGEKDQDGKGGYNPDEPKAENLTASADAPSELYENGEKVKGEELSTPEMCPDCGKPVAECACGGEDLAQGRAMPPYNAAGPSAQLVDMLSQGSGEQAAEAGAEQLSNGAAGVETPSASHTTHKEGNTMPDANEALQARLDELEQKLSSTVSALEAEKSEKEALKAQVDAAHQQLSTLAGDAAKSAQEAAELKLSQRAESLKQAGIAPVLVDEAVAVIKAAGTEQKLSMGDSQVSLADTLFGLLEKIPADQRVNLNQVGAKQTLSVNAGDNEPFVFEGVIKERMGQA